MRCLIITNHFYPESFRVNDVAFELSRTGHDVTVLTAIPDYPQGKFHTGYGYVRKRRETLKGVKVIRAAVIPRGKGGKLGLALNYLSVIISFALNGIWLAFTRRFDYIFVHDTSPAFIMIPAVMIKKVQKIPLDLWILDMWPESLIAGGIKNAKVHGIIQCMMDSFYKSCNLIHISSRGFREMLLKRNVPNELIRYLPNWNDADLHSSLNVAIPKMPTGFIIMFAGNLGEAQNLENVLAAANKLKECLDIHWVFVGDGRKRPWMENYVKANELSATVHLLGRYPIETMPLFFKKADIMLVSLSDSPVFNMTLPAKVQAYMANAKPILAMLNGEGQDIVNEAACGFCVDANDIDEMAKSVKHIAALSKEKMKDLGQRGYQFYISNFQKEKCIGEILMSMKRFE